MFFDPVGSLDYQVGELLEESIDMGSDDSRNLAGLVRDARLDEIDGLAFKMRGSSWLS